MVIGENIRYQAAMTSPSDELSSQAIDAQMQRVDARGLKCPLPVLLARKALLQLQVGESLEVLCTDPISVIDIPNLVRELGYQLQHSGRSADGHRFVISQEVSRHEL